MPVILDHVATGQAVAGPDTDTLNGGWSHGSRPGADLILVGFQYNTTTPVAKSIARTVTAGGHALTPLRPSMGQIGKGWGAPKKGYVEVWAGVGAAAAGGAIVADLAYDSITGDPFSPAHAQFSQFSGISLTYTGTNGVLPDASLHKRLSGRVGCGRLISVPISAFMDSLSVVFVGSDGAISTNVVPHATKHFQDAAGHLWVGDHQGPGTIRMENAGGNWGAVVVNLQPAAS